MFSGFVVVEFTESKLLASVVAVVSPNSGKTSNKKCIS